MKKTAPAADPTLPTEAAYLAAIVDSSDDAIIGKNLDGLITSWNRAAEGMFGYPPEEIIGRHVTVLFPDDRLSEEGEIMSRIRRAERVDHFETARLTKDGRVVPVSLTVSPILDARGAIIGVSKIVRDISERMNAEARNRQLQLELLHVGRLRAMGQMASALAHELNQPLSAVANYLSGSQRLLQADPPDLPLVREGVEKATEQALRMGQIIRRLRAFVERGDLDRKPDDLGSIAEEALELLGPTLKSQCRLTLSIAPGTPPVLADRVQIQQVLLNLLRNAIEAMSDAPVRDLTVCVDVNEAGLAQVSVQDTGPGIDPAMAANLFQPFVTSKADGMGVGLSISRTIIEAHGGSISAQAAPGGGARFVVALPALTDE